MSPPRRPPSVEEALTVAVTTADWLGSSVPSAGETSINAGGTACQCRLDAPSFVTVYVVSGGVNGPPIGPSLEKPVSGVTWIPRLLLL